MQETDIQSAHTAPVRRAVHQLNAAVARKIAAGEVIDRPNAIVRELMDNAVDSGADRISVEITGGGIEKIRVVDNGCGMTEEDLAASARPHATSKITSETDLLNLTTLGFRGEALASMAAVSRLSITSGGWKMNASVTEDHVLTPVTPVTGTIVQTAGLFENFPARRMFLKRPASEGLLCRTTFEEKVLPRPDIAFTLTVDGEEKLNLPAGQTLIERCTEALGFFENSDLFYEVSASSHDKEHSWDFHLIIGEPSVTRNSRKHIYTFINGRRISEYSLIQAIEYGCQGYFPNGLHPVACLFVTMNPALVDFNIHPAKKEARFKDIAPLHHAISTTVRDFFKQYTVRTMLSQSTENEEPLPRQYRLDTDSSISVASGETDFITAQGHNPSEKYMIKGTAFSNSAYGGKQFPTGAEPSSDTRSRFLKKTQSYPAESSYAHAVMKDFAQGMETLLGTASAEGHSAKPNYFVESPEQTEAQEYEDDKGFHFVGSTLGTFLIAEKNDTLYIIDQHAAHERYLYDKIMEDAGQKQALLVPYTVQTESAADDNYLTELQEKLEQAGFTGKNCGNGRWEFSTVPIRWKGTEADLARDLLDRRITPHDMINAVAASTACRSAVMDGTVLDSRTASWIAREALHLPDPHCPHGRPIFTTITRNQLFALVKRI